MGINQAAAMGGMFIGLVLGGVLAPINWRLIFLVSVPIGLFGTVWGYVKLRELSARRPARIDWPGNITFALGLVLVMVGITYGIEPYGHDTMGWANPFVLGMSCARRRSCWSFSGLSRSRSNSRCSGSSCSRSAPSPPGCSPASWPHCPGAGSCSCSSSGCRGSGCRSTATTSPGHLCGPGWPCSRSPPGSWSPGPLGHPVGPLRRPAVRHRWHGRHRRLLRVAGATAD